MALYNSKDFSRQALKNLKKFKKLFAFIDF